MREIRSYGSVGVRGGNEPHYPEAVSDVAPCKSVR